MIGNDVIDIVQTRKESNWQRRGFLDKLFTTDEQLIIFDYADPEIMVWVLWSMKEAAYKIYNRQTGVRAYIPTRLVCTIVDADINNFEGIVIIQDNIYYSKTVVEKQIINTIATITTAGLKSIREIKNISIIKDSNDLPYIYNERSQLLQPVSVSHHGSCKKIIAIV